MLNPLKLMAAAILTAIRVFSQSCLGTLRGKPPVLPPKFILPVQDGCQQVIPGVMAGLVPASGIGAARGWAYAPDSTVAEFIGNPAISPPARLGIVLADIPGPARGYAQWQVSF